MLKRLIEVALPLKEVSEQSAREKSIRHGHISTLHIWWARRPLAACRAVVFASLIPDPDDPECPDSFRQLVMEVLGRNEFRPKPSESALSTLNSQPSTPPDTPRNRCLEFIKHLVRWENSNNPDYIELARRLIAAAHKILHPDAEGDAPKVLDPFAGGGAIPLEALQLGCEAHAIDLNPVAHLIELCTLVYPQKYGQPDSRPVPDYIKRLIAHNRANKKGKDVTPLFDRLESGGTGGDTGVPPVRMERKFRRNLPHIQVAGSTYFLTWRCRDGITLSGQERTIALDAVRHWQGLKWSVIAAVVMPDHVHVLATPLPKAEGVCDLSEILHSVKSFSAHQINKARGRKGPVWLDETYDRIVRDEAELEEKYDYIRNNPIKNGLAHTTADYTWLIDQEEHRRDAGATEPACPTDGDTDGGTDGGTGVSPVEDDIIPDVEITEAEYRKNPLAADVEYWGHWVLEKARQDIAAFYPPDSHGDVPVAYLWARTVRSPDPTVNATIPLVRQFWLCKRSKRKVALRIAPNYQSGRCEFTVVEGTEIDFDPDEGTMKRGQVACPFTGTVMSGEDLRRESKAGRMGQQLIAVIAVRPGQTGKSYRSPSSSDEQVFQLATETLDSLKATEGASVVPNEPMTPDRPSPNSRGLSGVVRYGLDQFGKLFNARQSLAMATFARACKAVELGEGDDYCRAVRTALAMVLDRQANQTTTLCRMDVTRETLQGTYSRQALPMVWDYAEVNPIGDTTGGWLGALDWVVQVLKASSQSSNHAAICRQGSATAIPCGDSELSAVVTDPPYYDSVPYSDRSDFFYVWLKRSIGDLYPDQFRTPLTPKSKELIAYFGSGHRQVQKPPGWYEAGMSDAFADMRRSVHSNGIACVMFAHKTTTAWESAIAGMLKSGLIVTASWPLHTEMQTRMVARNAAALASSVTLVCRKREATAGDGLWDDVRHELKEVAGERLNFFWNQGIRGADFFISAMGPALSVFGQYERVTKLSGDEVTVGQFLDEVRALVTGYALEKILVYLIKAGGVKVGEATLRGNTLSFMQELSIAVANCPHACMIATLTSQISGYMDENAERAYESLEKVLGRIEKVRQTVEGAEIYEVIRCRLFEDLGDEAQHRATAEAYWRRYQEFGEDVPSVCREPSYREEVLRAYPFHPELITVLYERWGTIPEFQRTRGVLRLLADVISDLYQAKDNEVLIQSGSVNLGSSAVRSELVKHTGSGPVYHGVIDSDISGSHAKAPEIDRQLGSEYAKESVAEKLARAIFMYSFSGSQQRGATTPQLRVAVLNTEMAPPFVGDALDRMTKRLWYLYTEMIIAKGDATIRENTVELGIKESLSQRGIEADIQTG